MSKEIELVNVTIGFPKPMVDDIQKTPWFKYYHNFEEFVVDAVRRARENWDKVTIDE